ncbi:MAG TPA: uroporphyrinogen decarboxylase family protein [Candidatus Brocadiia bacterium]|nr:uroporphyrinogen decarboxylase family protein [Candidatus Brocadiia bacterium]
MNSRDRVMTVLRGEEPDRIPHFEWIIDPVVREAICPGASMEEFTVRMGLDAMLTDPDYRSEKVGEGLFRNEWGVVVKRGEEQHSTVVEPVIRDRGDLSRYRPPDPAAPHRFQSLRRLAERYKGKYAIGFHVNDVLSIPRNLMGFENLMMAFATDPDLVRDLVEMSVDINIRLAAQAARAGADFLFTGDDYSSGMAPFISPQAFRDHLFPGLKRVVTGFHDAGLPVIKHTDGNILPLMEMILEAGFDCLDPIDPLGGLEIGKIKKEYGDRIALKGNVACAGVLVTGSVKDVVRETLEVMRKAAPGGGFILSSSNSIHSSVRPENYLAMWNTARAYGAYPVDFAFDPCGAAEAMG